MIENIEELRVKAHLHPFGRREPLRQIEVTPGKIGTAQCIAAQAAELAVLGTVSSEARADTGIQARYAHSMTPPAKAAPI